MNEAERRVRHKLNRSRRKAGGRIVAVCPCCGKKHEVYSFWTGRGVPRFYCHECKVKHGFYDTVST